MKNLTYLILLIGFLIVSCSGGGSSEQAAEGAETPESSESAATEGPMIKGVEMTYSTDSTTMHGYLAFDANREGKRPGILVVHEWWGHNEYTRQRAEMLAELGYTAIAVDMYGDGKQADHPDDAGKFAGAVFANFDEAKLRFERAIEALKAHPTVNQDQISAIGYCFGGSVVLTMANSGYDLDAVAAFHSGVRLPVQPAEGFATKVLVCNGADDPMVSAESVDNFKASLDAVGADYKYIAYEGALHAYTNPGADELGQKFDLPLGYNEEADKAAWQELQDLLNSVY